MSSQEPVVGVDDPGHRKGTSLSDLPNELWVAIANSLDSEEDRDTLNVLCLTSRRWLFPAQQNLYGDFVIQGRDDRDILAFAQSLQDPTNSRCRFVTYIHTIRLVGTFDDSAAINLVHVVSLVKLLPSLRFLCLDYVTLKADKRDFSESLEDPTAVSRYPCERIDLKHVIFRGISFPLFINMFAGRHITLDAITCKNRRRAAIQYDDDDVKTVAISPPSLSGLRSLNVLSWYHFLLEEEEELPDLLMSACADGEIRAFRIPHALGCFRTPGTGPKPPEEFLLTKCRNLRYLQLDYSIVRSFASADIIFDEEGNDGFGGVPSHWQSINLGAACPALQTLSFILKAELPEEAVKFPLSCAYIAVWRHILRLVASTSRSSLRHIVISFPENMFDDEQFEPAKTVEGTWNNAQTEVHWVDWARWGAVLGEFERFESLEFTVLPREWSRAQGNVHIQKGLEEYAKRKVACQLGGVVVRVRESLM